MMGLPPTYVLRVGLGCADAWDVILLDEATDRFARAASAYGVRIRRWSSPSAYRRHLDRIERTLSPLRLPDELRAFWSTWDPSTIVAPALDGFIPLPRVLAERQIDCPPGPVILIPVANVHGGRTWVELASAEHPGGRIFHTSYDDSTATLWALGLSEFLDLLSRALERDAIDDRTAGLDLQYFAQLIDAHLDATVSPEVPRTVDATDRSLQPLHWRRAEGLPDQHFALRGSSHTVREFESARSGRLGESATIVGTYHESISGGPLRGSLGKFSDSTGSLQVFVPHSTALRGAVGDDGLVEIEVVAMRENGLPIESLSARTELQLAASLGSLEVSGETIRRLVDEMSQLDTSVVVTAMRPIRR